MAGVPFLTAQLGAAARIIVEIAWGADLTADASTWTWTDVSADVRQADGGYISISPFGRSDEISQAQPAGCTFQLDNTTGKYSKGPQSANYPKVRRGAPVRVSVALDGVTRFVRFFGYANGFTPSWDTTGNLAVVTVDASGALRRLGQGGTPKSALRRSIAGAGLSRAGLAPRAYWPLEDGTYATQAATPSPGVAPMSATLIPLVPGAIAAIQQSTVQFGAVDGPIGSDKLPNFTRGGQLSGTVPDGGVSTYWRLQYVAKVEPLGVSDFVVPVQVYTADGNLWEIYVQAIGSGGAGFITNGHTVATSFAVDDDAWHEFRLEAQQSGPDVHVTVTIDGITRLTTTLTAYTLTRVTTANVNPAASATALVGGIGHVAVWDVTVPAATLDTVAAMNGYNGEDAAARIIRLCAEEGVPVTVTS